MVVMWMGGSVALGLLFFEVSFDTEHREMCSGVVVNNPMAKQASIADCG